LERFLGSSAKIDTTTFENELGPLHGVTPCSQGVTPLMAAAQLQDEEKVIEWMKNEIS
jgi:hypothetical protein